MSLVGLLPAAAPTPRAGGASSGSAEAASLFGAALAALADPVSPTPPAPTPPSPVAAHADGGETPSTGSGLAEIAPSDAAKPDAADPGPADPTAAAAEPADPTALVPGSSRGPVPVPVPQGVPAAGLPLDASPSDAPFGTTPASDISPSETAADGAADRRAVATGAPPEHADVPAPVSSGAAFGGAGQGGAEGPVTAVDVATGSPTPLTSAASAATPGAVGRFAADATSAPLPATPAAGRSDGPDATSRAAASRPEDAEPQVAAPGGRVGAAAAVPVAPTTSAATHEADGAPRDPAPVQTTGTASPESPVRTAPPAAAPPPAATAAPRPPLVPQLVPHVTALAAAGDGDHEVTLTVSPEDLGPVTVRARISGDTMRIELFSPSDVGRDALRLVLADLRRDLAIAAPHATLSLATGETAPSAGHSSPQSSTHTGADGSQAGRDGAPQQAPRDGSPHATRDRAERPSPASRPDDADGGHARAATDSPLPSNGWAAAASFDVLA